MSAKWFKLNEKSNFYCNSLRKMLPEPKSQFLSDFAPKTYDEHWVYQILENKLRIAHIYSSQDFNRQTKLRVQIDDGYYDTENQVPDRRFIIEVKTCVLYDQPEVIIQDSHQNTDYYEYGGHLETRTRVERHPEVTKERKFLGFKLKDEVIKEAYAEEIPYTVAIAEWRVDPQVQEIIDSAQQAKDDHNRRLDLIDVWMAELGPKNETDDSRRNLNSRGIKKIPRGWKVTKTNEADGSKRLILTGGTEEVPSVEEIVELNVVEV